MVASRLTRVFLGCGRPMAAGVRKEGAMEGASKSRRPFAGPREITRRGRAAEPWSQWSAVESGNGVRHKRERTKTAQTSCSHSHCFAPFTAHRTEKDPAAAVSLWGWPWFGEWSYGRFVTTMGRPTVLWGAYDRWRQPSGSHKS